MKRFIGLFILVIVIVMISGCTQPAQPAAVTTPVATTVATAVPTVPPTVVTMVPTPAPTMEPTTVVTPMSNTTIVTTVATAVKTPIPVAAASTKLTTFYIRNNTFVPQLLTVLPGTGITWINGDTTVHAIKITGTHAGMFNSGDFMAGSQVGTDFGQEGTFDFIDTYSNATGMIIVKKGELLSGITTARNTSAP